VKAALESGVADRLGHAVSAFGDPKLVDRILKSGIHIELCPSSNICLGAVKSLAVHPILMAKKLGMNYSVNSDDPGAFGCSMESEWAKLKDELGFTAEDEEKVFENCMKSRFS
jgi:adenosine deaminase